MKYHGMLISALVVAMVSVPLYVSANRQEELKNQIQNRQQDIEKLEREIEQHQKDIEIVGGMKKTLQTAVKEIDVMRKKLNTDIALTGKKIDQTSLTIEELAIEIKDKEIRIERDRDAMRKIIQLLNEQSQGTLVELFLSAERPSDVFADMDNLSRIQEKIGAHVEELKLLRVELGLKKDDAEKAKEKLMTLNDQIQDQKYIADQKRREQDALLKDTQNKEANYKKLLADKQTRIKQFQKDIDEFEDQLRIELDPSSIPQAGMKALAWPLDSVFVTQKFGSSASAKRLYTTGTHNGIDFRAAVGTQVRAAASGVVVDAGDTDVTCRGASYGKWVLIRHNNGLSTLYAHLSLIRVTKGESVNPGATIGYSGNTGYSTGPHLHFTVFATAAVRVADLPSASCKNATYHIPVSARNGYLDPESFLY